MSKRVFFFGLAVVVVALAFLLADELLWQPGVSASSVRRIKPGMARQQVEVILGGGSSYFTIHPNNIHLPMPAVLELLEAWEGSRGIAVVRFDDNDSVESASFEPAAQTGLLDQIRCWLGW